jgi:hypothetical protein
MVGVRPQQAAVGLGVRPRARHPAVALAVFLDLGVDARGAVAHAPADDAAPFVAVDRSARASSEGSESDDELAHIQVQRA